MKLLYNTKGILLLLCLCPIAKVAFGQAYAGDDSYAPPSPNAYNLAMLSNTSVNLHTGTAEVNLPLFELRGRNLKVPIALAYNASGIKVQDVPSWVGLGWSLQAGGVVTRVVKGLPDEEVNGFCGTNNIGEKASLAYTTNYVEKVNDHDWDAEPDIFYFNFLGKTGKFILDEAGNPVQLPYGSLKITPGICPTATTNFWTITDESGTQYIFGKNSTERESSHYYSTVIPTPDPYAPPYTQLPSILVDMTFISSWYLSEIKTANGDESIVFSYTNGPEYEYEYFTQQQSTKIYLKSPWTDGCITKVDSTLDANMKITVLNPVYLNRIVTTLGSADFSTKLSAREDLPAALAIDKMIIKAGFNTVSNYVFKTGYFQSDGCTTSLCKRLKLLGVDVGQSVLNNLYRFEYNSLNLPARDSHKIDHWGYYNSNTFDSKIPAVTDSGPCGGFFDGADRSADSLRSKANILSRIYETTGGYTEFRYEGHVYNDNGVNTLAGGSRIKSTRKCDNTGGCIASYYSYNKFSNPGLSSGTISSLPEYSFRSYHSIFQPTSYTPPAGFTVTTEYLIRISNSQDDLFNLNGYHVGYSNVVEDSGNGYIENVFTDVSNHPDYPVMTYPYSTVTGVGTGAVMNVFPYVPPTSKIFERGLIVEKNYKDESDRLVKSQTYTYDFSVPTFYREVPGVKVGKRAEANLYGGSYYYVGRYNSVSRPYLLTSVTDIVYDQGFAGDPTKKTSTSTTFFYIPAGQSTIAADLQPRKIVQTLPDGDEIITENKLSADYVLPAASDSPPVKGLRLLAQKNISAPVIESITYKKINGINYLIKGDFNIYLEFSSGKVYPATQYKMKIQPGASFSSWVWSSVSMEAMGDIVENVLNYPAVGYKAIKTFLTYDSYGNPLTMTGEDGITSVMTWANNNSLISSITQNAGSYQHSQTYLHAPLVGTTQITDANARSGNFVFDSFNRLKLVKDNDGNILKRHLYHFAGESMDMPGGSIVRTSGCNMINHSITFNATGEIPNGETKYEWNFGDGTTAVTYTSTASHTYTTSGQFTVQVQRSNPEYFGQTTSSLSMFIGAPVTVASICANGITVYDVCGVDQPNVSQCTIIEALMAGEDGGAVAFTEPGGGTVQPPFLRVDVNGYVVSYQWRYRIGTGSWINFSTAPSVVGPPGFGTGSVGTWSVVCDVTDDCGATFTTDIFTLNAYKSSNCF